MYLRILVIVCSLLNIPRASSNAVPPNATDPSGFTIYIKASDYFPRSKADLSPFDIDVYFGNFDAATKSWLTALDPNTGTTDEEKARIITEISYARQFDANDTEMAQDVQSLLAAVAGNSTTATAIPPPSLSANADLPYFVVGTKHVVKWAGCTPFYQCVTGYLCPFPLNPSYPPRNHCERHGGSLCCISWSNYNVVNWFFERTWTACDQEVRDRGLAKASCEGYGADVARGNICLSNRPRHC